ncbi:MAG: LytR family transcriptional regulator [Acidimicrobiia bacterium]|nr:LytR family transcriptional regulator [Acidimicrobiia bacterium]
MENTPSSRRVFASRYAIAFGLAAVVMAFSVIGANWVYDKKIDKIGRVQVRTAPAPTAGANYLLIGSDTRAFVENAGEKEAFGSAEDETGQRSDTIMVIHVEPGAQKTLLVSFPRDLYVEIPGGTNCLNTVDGRCMNKINAAFTIGRDKVIETLRVNFGIEINHYLEVDFKSFQGVVNAIGSVPTYFPYPARDLETNLKIALPGCNRLSGPDALAYVRSRTLEYLDVGDQKWVSADAVPDINRILRQQAFIRSMAGLAVAKSLNDPFTALEITDRVVENLKADQSLTRDDIDSLVVAFRTVNPKDQSALNMQTFPWGPGPDQSGANVLYPSDPAWREMARRLGEFGTVATTSSIAPSSVKLRVLNESGATGAAGAALDELAKIGFERAGASEGEGDLELTEVRYARGAEEQGKLVLSYIDPSSARLVLDPSLKGADVALVLGHDFASILVPETLTSTTVTTPGDTGPTLVAPEGLTPAPILNESELGEPAPKTPPC